MKRLVFEVFAALCLIFLPAAASAGSVWVGHPTTIESPFHRAWRHHQGCGSPTSNITYGYYGAAHMRFQHCTMTFSRVYVTRSGPSPVPATTVPPTAVPPAPPPPTSQPSAIPTTIPYTATPTPSATATATDTPQPFLTWTPVPMPAPSTDPVAYELSLLNSTRAQYGVAPLSLNPTQSSGIGACVGSLGHSQAMAQSGQIWHINPAYPAASFPNNLCVFGNPAGENVGAGTVFGDPRPMLQQLHASMMAEGTSNCGSVISHACNIINPAFHQVGIGILVQNGNVWLTTDFLGN